MTTYIRYFAVALWLASWLAPTLISENGKYLLGYELAAKGLGGMLFFLPLILITRPLYLLSLATNLLIANEAVKCFRREESSWTLKNAVLFQAAFFINVGVVSALSRGKDFPQFRGILGFPGAYLWLGAFGLLALVTVGAYRPLLEYRSLITGLFMRLMFVGGVAISVVAIFFAIAFVVVQR